MSEIYVKLSELSRPSTPVNDSDVVFISQLNDTENISTAMPISDLRDLLNFETAYDTTTIGLSKTKANQIFYVYTDSQKLSVNPYYNRNGVAEVITDSTGDKLQYSTLLFMQKWFTYYGYSLIKEVPSFAALRTLPVLVEGQKVKLRGYYENTDVGGGTFIGHIGTATDDGGVIAAGNGFYWERVITDSIISIDFFGAVASDETSYSAKNKAAIFNCFDLSLKSKKYSVVIPAGHFIFDDIVFKISDYTSVVFNEFALTVNGVSRILSWLDGSIFFDSEGLTGGWPTRWVGLNFSNILFGMKWKVGNSLVISRFGKITTTNCHFRANGGVGLGLYGGSEYTGHHCEFYSSNKLIELTYNDFYNNELDLAVVSFYDCNFSNAGVTNSSTATTFNIVSKNQRKVYFHGGNMVTNNAVANFTGAYVVFDCVDFENKKSMFFTDSIVKLENSLVAVPTTDRFVLTNSTYIEGGNNSYDSSVSPIIRLKDTLSVIDLTLLTGSCPTFFLDHSVNTTNQIIFKKGRKRPFNCDFDFSQLWPNDVSAPMTWDSTSFINGRYSLVQSVAGYFPFKFNYNGGEISAIELITRGLPGFSVVDNGTVYDASKYGIWSVIQNMNNSFTRRIFVPNKSLLGNFTLRLVLPVGVVFDSYALYADTEVANFTPSLSAIPDTGSWRKGAVVYNTTVTDGSVIGWVATKDGTGTGANWVPFGGLVNKTATPELKSYLFNSLPPASSNKGLLVICTNTSAAQTKQLLISDGTNWIYVNTLEVATAAS